MEVSTFHPVCSFRDILRISYIEDEMVLPRCGHYNLSQIALCGDYVEYIHFATFYSFIITISKLSRVKQSITYFVIMAPRGKNFDHLMKGEY